MESEETGEIQEVPQANSPASGRLQTLANVLTILVAVSAIGLSIWEGRENRLHNRLSVLPHLKSIETISREGIQDSSYTMTYALDNSGLGPAVLRSLIVYRDESKVYDSNISESDYDFQEFLGELEQLPFPVSTFTNGRKAEEMLRAGVEHLFFRLEVPVIDTLEQWSAGIVLNGVINRYSFVFCYCSVYEENCGEVVLGSGSLNDKACH